MRSNAGKPATHGHAIATGGTGGRSCRFGSAMSLPRLSGVLRTKGVHGLLPAQVYKWRRLAELGVIGVRGASELPSFVAVEITKQVPSLPSPVPDATHFDPHAVDVDFDGCERKEPAGPHRGGQENGNRNHARPGFIRLHAVH
jgi:hypothetical protein